MRFWVVQAPSATRSPQDDKLVAHSSCPRRKPKRPRSSKSKAFIEKARELGADVDKDDDEVMRRLAKQKRRNEASGPKTRNP
jgi:hypothetical protein